MAAEIAERAASLDRLFATVLNLGAHDDRLGPAQFAGTVVHADAGPRFAALGPMGVVCDEDRLPFADGSFDLVVSAGSLHGVNDLPGALIQVRRMLRPGGAFLAAFPGGRTLQQLRSTLIAAEAAVTGGASPRTLPMVDPAEAGALLQRAGFTRPVADVESLIVRYASLFDLIRDLRGAGEASILSGQRTTLRRDVLARAAEAFAALADSDGRVSVTVEVLYLTGWAP